jgi:hypothetical protein
MKRRARVLPAVTVLCASAALALATATAGCAGARVEITADSSRYAISMSELVRDSTGRLHDRTSLEKVGAFKVEATRVGFFYSLLTIPWTIDISDDVNAQVSAAGGEAIVRAAVSVTGSCDVLNSFLLLNAVPLWPGCVPVTVTGDIVRRRAPRPVM